MNTTRFSKAPYLVALTLIIALAATAAWYFFAYLPAGYPREVIKQANALQERIISFDSHITVPVSYTHLTLPTTF